MGAPVMARMIRWYWSITLSSPSKAAMPCDIAALRSAPAQNAPPAPVSTTARTAGSSATAVSPAPRAASSEGSSALRDLGRLSVSTATPPSRSMRRTSSVMREP
ncbi:MAG: hypothetical protein QM820_62970 [Minicystis sp.]